MYFITPSFFDLADSSIQKVYSAPPNALNIYNPQDKNFFIGQGLNKRNNFKGRESELDSLHQLVNSNGEGDPKSVFISGIGGMGYVANVSLTIHFF